MPFGARRLARVLPVNDIRLLIVEDDALFAEAVAAKLDEAVEEEVSLTTATTLASATSALAGTRFDAIILDLSLPDAAGLEALEAVHDANPEAPIVVLTGTRPKGTGVEALRRGAQDYLVKSDADGGTIARAVRHAIERQRITAHLERTVARLQGEAPLGEEGSEEATPIKEALPELHRELGQQYADVVAAALRPGQSNTAEGIQEIAERLFRNHAGPKDVVDVHLNGMAGLPQSDRRSAGTAAEGQIIMLELMGRTLGCYRDQRLGLRDQE